jgi:hypothetical protein
MVKIKLTQIIVFAIALVSFSICGAYAQTKNKPRVPTICPANYHGLVRPAPVAPSETKRTRISDMVQVKVIIDENGKVISARCLCGHRLLQPVALKGAYKEDFSPTLMAGKPVKVAGTIIYKFILE